MSSTTEDRVQQTSRKLVGLELTAVGRSADLRGFHFGELRPHRNVMVGELALHVHCAWRIEGPDGVRTGRSDLWQPTLDLWDDDLKRWDHERDGNLQDKRLAECLDAESRPSVPAARAMPCGGAELDLSGGWHPTLKTRTMVSGKKSPDPFISSL